jgi:hypothetical protein
VLFRSTVTNMSPGAVKDTIKFEIGGWGFNWCVGTQAQLGASDAMLFLEMNNSGAIKTVYSSSMKPETRRLLTALSSHALAEQDPSWFKRLAFPVLAAGAAVRGGFRYYF